MRRRTFLRSGVAAGLVSGLAGCASDTGNNSTTAPRTTTDNSATTTEAEQTTEQPEETTDDQPDIDRPANYRWDMCPGRNDLLREELGQYVEASVGNVVEEHPAFEYSTDSERDDHSIDFEALKLFRDSNFDILKRDSQNPLERWVEAFVNEDLYADAKREDFHRTDVNSPEQYSTEAWQNAETVEESLDLGHGLVLTIGDPINVPEHAAVMREAYKRYHDFDVLAWETPNQGGVTPSGLMYSPNDDTIRSFDHRPSEHTRQSTHYHTPVQDWPFITEGDHHHPLLFHTDEWNRGDVDGFGHAKGLAAAAISSIGGSSLDIAGVLRREAYPYTAEYSVTTGLMKQLTRTALEYNSNDAEFQDLWDYANVVNRLELQDGRYVIDSGTENDDYEGIFEGNLAVYEIKEVSALSGGPTPAADCMDTKATPPEDEEAPTNREKRLTCLFNQIWDDKQGQFNNFGQLYDELAAT